MPTPNDVKRSFLRDIRDLLRKYEAEISVDVNEPLKLNITIHPCSLASRPRVEFCIPCLYGLADDEI